MTGGDCANRGAVPAGPVRRELPTESASVPALDLTEPATTVAPTLLGAVLTSTTSDGPVSVRIVEVEAYRGAEDPGSHAFRGRSTRNATMFGPPGHVYVYRHLGLHHCVNLVCSPQGTATAVLLRAGEVVAGHQLAWERRLASGVCRTERDLARGPARLAVVLGLTLADDGAPVTVRPVKSAASAQPLRSQRCHPQDRNSQGGTPQVPHPGESGSGAGTAPSWLELVPGGEPVAVRTGPRVGVSGVAGTDAFPWRYSIDGDPHVSDFRAGRGASRT